MIIKFNVGTNVITGYGRIGTIKSITVNKDEETRYLVQHPDNTEVWHLEHDLDIVIGDQYLTENNI